MSSKIKIGIVTYIYAVNHGSIMQALAVKKIAENIWPDSEITFVNYAPGRGLYKELKNNIINKRLISGIKVVILFKKFINKHFNFSKKICVTDIFANAVEDLKKYDLDICLIGSDSVWECRPKGLGYAPTPPNLYFCSSNNIPKCKFISISPSSDRSIPELWPRDKLLYLRDSISSYKFISVRDYFTKDLLINFFELENEVHVLPDPTFAVDHSHFKNMGNNLKKIVKGEYVLLDVSNRELSKLFRIKIKSFNPNLTIISPQTNRYSDINLRGKITPFDWVELHANSKFTFTNRFHGTVFSIKFGRYFISLDESPEYASGASSKKEDLLSRAGLISNYLPIRSYNYEELGNLLAEKVCEGLLNPTFLSARAKKATKKFKQDWHMSFDLIKETISA